MDNVYHVIKRVSNPRFMSQMVSYDVASIIHQSLYQTTSDSLSLELHG